MAEDKQNTGPEGTVPGEPETESTIPGTDPENTPAQDNGDVVIDFDKINQLMAERRAAAREEVEKTGYGDLPEPGKHSEDGPPLPEPGEHSEDGQPLPEPEEHTEGGPPRSGIGDTVKEPAPGGDSGQPLETAQEELDAKESKKPRRGRPPKSEKTSPEAREQEKSSGKSRKGRPTKDKGKAANGKKPEQRDTLSQSEDDLTPAQRGAKKRRERAVDLEGTSPLPDGKPIPEPQRDTTPDQPSVHMPQPTGETTIVYLKLSEVHPFHTFRPHPFKVRDEELKSMVESIKANGVLEPGLARPEKDGNGYEIIAGHRRSRSCELAEKDVMPFIVKEMTDHEAVQAMKDSNKQRNETLPSELAALLELEVEDIKHQGGRLKGVAEGDIGKRSVEIVGEMHGLNYKKVMRYMRLNSLVPELLEKVDGVLDENGKRKKGIGFMPAVELSYIRPKNQRLIAVSMDGEQMSPSVAQAKRLRELDEKNLLNGDVIDQILTEKKKEVDRVIITTDELNQYFGKETTPRQMKDQIMALLDEWKAKQPPEKQAPETER